MCHSMGLFILTSMPDNARANECVWIPHSFQYLQHGQHFRDQLNQTLAQVSQMVHTGHIQALRWSATSYQGRPKCEELAA